MSETTLPFKRSALERLKVSLGQKLLTPGQVTPPAGLGTGWPSLDQYLLWKGFPKGAVSLLIREAGGATRLWQRAAGPITQRDQWVAWVDGPESQLTPWSLRRAQVNLSKMLCVAHPVDHKQLLWSLQELMSLCLFEMVGCDLGHAGLRDHEVLKLKKLAARYQTSLVLFTDSPQVRMSSAYSLILHFQRDHVVVQRALHRPTPYLLERRDLYADTLPQLTAGRRALCG